MLFYVADNEIVGDQANPDSLPNGWAVAEGADLPIEMLYWDGEAIQERPPRPGEEYYWSRDNLGWEQAQTPVPQVPTGPPSPGAVSGDWERLEASLRQSSYFYKGYESAGYSLKSNRAFTLLLNTIRTGSTLQSGGFISEASSLKLSQDLRFATLDLKAALAELGASGSFPDFTEEELASLEEMLADCGFEVALS